MSKLKIGVFFGGGSFEHDVSILTGLQVCQAMDITRYEPIPFYVDLHGNIWTGGALASHKTYPLTDNAKSKLTLVVIGSDGKILSAHGMFRREIKIDAALLAFHGGAGESGAWAGLLEVSGIPFAGAKNMASGVYMSKYATKLICRALGIKVLNEIIAKRPAANTDILVFAKNLGVKFPVIVKPESMGSSVGVSRANNNEELAAGLMSVFKLGDNAMIEPFVENLAEYNVAVMRRGRDIITSAIEMPKNGGRLLTFANKYMSGGSAKKKIDADIDVMPSDGLLSMGRDLEPALSEEQESFIRESAIKLFGALGTDGAPRIDFYGDKNTGEIWLNEVNPIPGAFAFYLWRAAKDPMTYTDIITNLIENALNNTRSKSYDLNSSNSRVFN
ncbi:MAG: hypothetical protein LBJ73_01685 [Rickettsiales bacterium]|jgi:D-alanine-D-alanine ligase|nr:hypothetical protein [Rickettsiales bacterium]